MDEPHLSLPVRLAGGWRSTEIQTKSFYPRTDRPPVLHHLYDSASFLIVLFFSFLFNDLFFEVLSQSRSL